MSLTLRTLASGAHAVINPEDRSRALFISRSVLACINYIDEVEIEEYIYDEDGSIAFAEYLERQATKGTWFGREDF